MGSPKGRKERFYLMMHSTPFIYGFMVSDIWLKDHSNRERERGNLLLPHGLFFPARVLLYAPSHRHDSTCHSLCHTSRGSLAGMRNSSMEDRSDNPSHHERTPIPQSYISLLTKRIKHSSIKLLV